MASSSYRQPTQRTGVNPNARVGPMGPVGAQGPFGPITKNTGGATVGPMGPAGPMGEGGPLDPSEHSPSSFGGAIPQAHAAAAPTRPDYMSQYQDSLAKSREAINQQLMSAMADINGNEQRAGTMISGLPAQYQAAYGQAQGGLNTAAATLDAHQQAGGAGSQTGYSKDWLAPEQQAMTGSLTALQQQVPQLQLAAQSEYANRRGQATAIANDQLSALDTAQREALTQQAGFQHDTDMETQREQAANGGQSHVGSAQWWADEKNSNPLKTNAMEARAGQVGFLKDLQAMSPRDRNEYLANVGKQSPRLASMIQYEMAVAAQGQKKAKPKSKA